MFMLGGMQAKLKNSKKVRTSQTNDFLEEVTGFDGSWKRGQGHSNEHFKSRPVVHLRALRRFTADHNLYPILNLL